MEFDMRVTAETKTATRLRILESAQELFAKKGFEQTTTRDIAHAARIASGTLFNYFSTKEAIVGSLVCDAYAAAAQKFSKNIEDDATRSLEEKLFSHVAITLRKLNPYRKYLNAVLETALSPLAAAQGKEGGSLRLAHLETVVGIVTRHGAHDALSAVALQIYWTLFTGVLAYWTNDKSPRQEDTLALLDQSVAMFVAWLTGPSGPNPNQS
jgi:AcrR family transcriptional regulator